MKNIERFRTVVKQLHQRGGINNSISVERCSNFQFVDANRVKYYSVIMFQYGSTHYIVSFYGPINTVGTMHWLGRFDDWGPANEKYGDICSTRIRHKYVACDDLNVSIIEKSFKALVTLTDLIYERDTPKNHLFHVSYTEDDFDNTLQWFFRTLEITSYSMKDLNGLYRLVK